MFSISFRKYRDAKKKSQLVYFNHQNANSLCSRHHYVKIETFVKLEQSENAKKLWKHSPAACVPAALLVLRKIQFCFYNSIETQYMFYIS